MLIKTMAQTVVKLCYLAICVFLFSACSSNKTGRGVDTGYYQNLTTKIITGADVLNTLEIDSGKYTLLMCNS